MICQRCNNLLPIDSRFCAYCGLLQPSSWSLSSRRRSVPLVFAGLMSVGVMTLWLSDYSLKGSPAESIAASASSSTLVTAATPEPQSSIQSKSTAQIVSDPAEVPTPTPKTTIAKTPLTRRIHQGPPSSYFTGPRGGCYYINANGNKTYVSRSLCR
jgi:hypothetical protein